MLAPVRLAGPAPPSPALLEERPREAYATARLASWEWDPATNALIVSPELPRRMGIEPSELSRLADVLALVDAPWRAGVAEGLATVATEGRDYRSRFRLAHPTPGLTWLELEAWAVRDEAGAGVIVRGTTRDVTAEHEAQEEARRALEFYQATLDAMPAHVAVLDERGVVLATNRAWDRYSSACGGYAQRPRVGTDYLAVCDGRHEPEAGQVAAALRAMLGAERDEAAVEYCCDGTGRRHWFRMRVTRFDGDGPARLVVQHEDVSAQRVAERDARLRSSLLDELNAAVIAVDADWLVTDWNATAERLYGWSRAEAVGRLSRELITPEELSEEAAAAREDLTRTGHWEGVFLMRRRDGTTFPALVHNTAVLDDDGSITGYVGVSMDISERLRAERELRSAQQYLGAIAQSMGEGLCALDEEGRLTYMNAAAERMLGWTLEELAGRSTHEAMHFRRPDGSPFPKDECPLVRMRATGEVLRAEEDVFVRRDGSDLPVEYTAAPFETPDGVGGTVVVFSDITERKAERERMARELEDLTWVGRIREALQHERLRLHAQPIVDVRSGEVVQHELLIRMLDDDGGLVPPGVFLPIAERHRVIADIDRWVIDQAAALAACGHAVELNLSAASIGDPTLADAIEAALTAAGADPSLLVIELTETAVLSDEEAGRSFLERVVALGCEVALDDFGTGYGGFTYLKRLPIDYLKIDVEFVRDLPRDPASRHVIEAVVNLARGLGKRTVAEGVEDGETLGLLRTLGVDFAQGYAIGRPAPVEAVMGPRREEERHR